MENCEGSRTLHLLGRVHLPPMHFKLEEQNVPVSLTDNVFPLSRELSDCNVQGQAMARNSC
jgi:hypothetical protein